MPFLVLFLAGFAGLVHEVVWARWFALSYGGTAPAAAAVIAAYLAGLAAGGALLGRLADRAASARRMLGWLELGAGAASALLVALPLVLPRFYASLAGAGSSAAWTAAVRFGLAAAFLLVPAFLMGGALPAAVRWRLSLRETGPARAAGRLRASNCAGAALGALVAAYVMIPSLGLRLTVLSAAGINMLAGLLAFAARNELTNPFAAKTPERHKPPKSAQLRGMPAAVALAAAALVGALALSAELVQMRAVAFFTASTVYSFAAVSAACIAALGAGSYLGGWLVRRPQPASAAGSLGVVLALAAAAIGLSAPTLAGLGPGSGAGTLALLAAAPSALFLGAAFPLVLHLLAPAAGRLGRTVGLTVAALEVGAVAGPALAALVLLPALGTKYSLITLAAAAALAALALVWLGARSGLRLAFGWRLVVIAALPVAVWPALGADIYSLSATQPRAEGGERPVLESQVEDPEAVVSVTSTFEPEEARRVTRVFVGRKQQADDITPWLAVERRMGALPALLAPHEIHGRALHIGLGSGVTAAWSAAAVPGRKVECAELVPAVAAELPRFRPHNAVAPFRVTVADGRTRLLAEPGAFELIVTDIVFPEDAGAGGLFSYEYFALARSRLREGGMLAEWLPLFQMPPESFASVVRAFLKAFPDATMWAGCLDGRRPVVMLLGVREEEYESFPQTPVHIGERLRRLPAGRLAPAGLGSLEEVISHYIAGPRKLGLFAEAHPGPAASDDLPLVELSAGRSGTARDEWSARNLELVVKELWDPRGRWELPPDAKHEALPGVEAARPLRAARRLLAEAGVELCYEGGARTALGKLHEAARLAPRDAEVRYALWMTLSNLGLEMLASGRPDLARDALEESQKFGPPRDYTSRALAESLAALGDRESALKRAKEAVALDRRSPPDPENAKVLDEVKRGAGKK